MNRRNLHARRPTVTEAKPDSQLLTAAYEATCFSYHRIDDFRAKLLALLPIVSGAGIFILLRDGIGERPRDITAAAAIFGLLVSVGLYFYELRGVQRCIRLATVAKSLESAMAIKGQFTEWPHSVGRFINEPIAAATIYPAVLAAWVYLGAVGYSKISAGVAASAVFTVGFLGGWIFYRHVREA
jgi:hypothetical protein